LSCARLAAAQGAGNAGDAKALLDDAVKFCPDTPEARNELAWVLVRYPGGCDDAVRLARELAVETTQKVPQSGPFWNTLGVAHYRAGDWTEALRALDKSRLLGSDDGFAHNAFFLAMAEKRAGNDEPARRWYRRATDWTTNHRPHDLGLRR